MGDVRKPAGFPAPAFRNLFYFPPFRNLIIEEKSYVPFEDLIYGRMSFQGFNPEVEVCVRFCSNRIVQESLKRCLRP